LTIRRIANQTSREGDAAPTSIREACEAAERKSGLAKEKSQWIAAARRTFSPGTRKPCEVCGKYETVTQAHHIIPLVVQFYAGYEFPDETFCWLCPTHHALVHAYIDAVVGYGALPVGVPATEIDKIDVLSLPAVKAFNGGNLPRLLDEPPRTSLCDDTLIQMFTR
jgi:hypothetical protein